MILVHMSTQVPCLLPVLAVVLVCAVVPAVVVQVAVAVARSVAVQAPRLLGNLGVGGLVSF